MKTTAEIKKIAYSICDSCNEIGFNQVLEGLNTGIELCQKEYEEKLRWIPIEEKVPEIKKDTYQVLIEKQDGMLDLIFIHKTMLDYEVKEILIDWHKAVRWRYIFL